MAKENPNVEAAAADASQNPAEEVVPKVQYDALAKQFQDVVAEANRRLAILEADKKLLSSTLEAQNQLIKKFLKDKED